MTCEVCKNFPVPGSNFEVLKGGENGSGTHYRCKQCGMLFEVLGEKMFSEKRDVHFIPINEVGWERTWIVSDEPVETKPRGLLKSVGFVLGGLLTSIPGIAAVALGVHGLLGGRMYGKHGREITGEAAISYSWCLIGVGLWAFGYLGTFCYRWGLLKVFAYVLAGGAVFWSIVIMIRYIF